MGARDHRRILNKIAALKPGIRQALDALNALNKAIEDGVQDRKVIQAFDYLQQAANIWREEAEETIEVAREICEIRYPNKLPARREDIG